MNYSPPGSFGQWDFPGKHTGVGCHFFLQGSNLTQGSNQSLLHRQEMHHWATRDALTCATEAPKGSPGVSVLKKKSAWRGRRRWRHGFDPRVEEIPWRRKWQPTPVFLPRKSHGQRSLVGYSPWGHRVRLNWASVLWNRASPSQFFVQRPLPFLALTAPPLLASGHTLGLSDFSLNLHWWSG